MKLFLTDSVGNYDTFLVFIIIILTIYYLRQRSISLMPRGPTPLPIVGNILSYGKQPWKNIIKWAEHYGDVMTLYQGPFRTTVWINDANLAINLFQKQPDIFSERKHIPFMTHEGSTEGSIVWENGPAWKTKRRWMLSALRHFGMGKRSLEKQINAEADIFCQEAAKFKSQPFDPKHFVNCAVANIICSISFGQRYDYLDPEFTELLKNLLAFFRQCNLSNIEMHIPSIMNLPMFRHKRIPSLYLINFLKNQVKQHKETFDPDNIRDIIDRMLSEVQISSDEEKSYTDPEHIWSSILTIFIAGAETTFSTLMWFLLYVASYQDVQAKLHEEIDRVLEGSKPTMADRTRLPYFEATTYEVQRLGNIAGTSLPHANAEEFVLKGHKIPKGTIINLNLKRIHTDPKYWHDPMTFNPARFLDEDGQKVKKLNVFMPFGIGRRACLGESLAKMEMFLFMTNFFQKFKVTIPEGHPQPDFDPVVGLTMSPKQFKVCAIPRG
ncbi:cytochrome P450 2C23-like [Anneissia japonica]|uniref:cytochrome P450 2C23-like n=1 Tax=Anneissia japonica TaxID=1529436 RepID=UPI001425AE4F|nr:cytochrome P450 2C23-like [Anneissia japonica]